ncbi:MAG: Cytochrome c [Phycisphaerales bacterium]|nr:Cytochrome c [Phycisphaerales bacterium]
MRNDRIGSKIVAAAAALLVGLGPAMAADKAKPKRNSDHTQWDDYDYGPFLSASIQAPAPADNITYKGVAVKLGKVKVNDEEIEASACFDTQLLRMSAAWTGGFLRLRNVAYTGDHGPCPAVSGDEKFGTRNAPGWADKSGSFKDPRVELYGEPYGGMPREYLHYKGLYRHGEQVAFAYTVNGMEVLESPGAKQLGDEIAFTRSFQVGPSTVAQTLVVTETDKAEGNVSDQGGKIATLSEGDRVTAAGVVQSGAQAELSVAATEDKKGEEIRLTIPPHAGDVKFEVVIWSGAKADLAKFMVDPKSEVPDVAALTKGGPAHWPQEISGGGQLAIEPTKDAAKAAYVLDEITPPLVPGNYPPVRFGGFDFFPDGHTAALCTWNGDVYVVKGIDEKLDHLTWRRIAGGMFQTLGLKIIDNQIYVHGRDQITRLHDLDGDGEPDFYENFNNDVAMTDHFHEFAFDLQQDKEGNLYIIKGGGVNPGGGGFQRPITRNHGTVMKISKYGDKLETIASGFRAPNGMCVSQDGQVVTGDNQGSWTPVDRINWIKPGGFYGVPELSHKTPEPTITDNPLCWMIYPSWDNSCGDPVFVTSDKFGPFTNELFYVSYGQTSLLHILKEEVDGQIQGGAVRFPWHFNSGSMRSRFNPVDGQLYVCGFQGWQTNAKRQTAFERVRYTGKPVYMPTALHVKDNGIEITFTQPLKKESAEDAGAWAIEQWNYRWTNNYGSPEVKISDPMKGGHDPLDVKSVKISEDGKTVFLEVPDLQPVMQMLIRGSGIEAADGTPVTVEIANTINRVKGKTLVVEVGKVSTK